jgi:hypothetical protein
VIDKKHCQKQQQTKTITTTTTTTLIKRPEISCEDNNISRIII